jgi:transposase-like protein
MGSARVEALFKGRQFDQEIIVLCVRWYLRYKLSTRDLVEMMAERGVSLVHTTILRWVQHYVPEFEKCWSQYARPVGGSWRCDETYIKVKGRWAYLYRAVDKVGRTIDFYLSERRDVNAAKHFFRKAMNSVGPPRVITLDAYAASHRAVRELKSEGRLPRRVRVRSSKYLNNMIEQDHRRIKQRTRPMLGFKRFDSAAVTSAASNLCRRFRSISSRPAHWVVAWPQCRKFGTPCWPPDPNFKNPKSAPSTYKLCTGAA